MLTARKYRNRASKLVILSIGSRLEGNAFGLPVPWEIGHGLKPSSFIFPVEPYSHSADGTDPVTYRKDAMGRADTGPRMAHPPGFEQQNLVARI